MAALKAWLRREGLWLLMGETTSSAITHVFLDGGKASIPLERMDEFFAEYAKCIASDDVPSAVERITTDTFKMFMDVDLKSFNDDLESTADQILEALPEELDIESIIVCSKPRDKKHRKEGLHMIWEGLYVTMKDALRLLAVTANNLKFLFPSSVVDWQGALDGSVYKSTGIRMAYSAKGQSDSSAYVPWFVSTRNGLDSRQSQHISPVVDDVIAWLKRCSIVPADGSVVSRTNKSERTKEVARCSETDDAYATVVKDTPYAGCAYKTVKLDAKTFIVKLNSKFCMNVDREHKTNKVYLIVTRDKVEQACYCRCPDTGCAEWRKTIASRGNALSLSLFGKRKHASVLPSSSKHAAERWSSKIATLRG